MPHICWDLLEHVQDDDAPLLSCISTTVTLQRPLQALSVDMHNLCRLPHRPVFFANYDSLSPVHAGANNRAGIAYTLTGGLRHMSSIGYLELISSVRPQAFQSLSDADTPKDASKKRLSTALKRTLEYLDELRLRQEKQLTSVSGPVFGSVVGGFDMKSRLICVKDLKERNVDGYVLEGFHDYGTERAGNLDEETVHLLQQVIAELPTEKPKALFGSFTPEVMLQLMKAGVDMFDSSYATMLTEQGCALMTSVSPASNAAGLSVRSHVLHLNKGEFKEDMNVIDTDCGCYSCKKSFTRAYINHLLVTKEMLASVLLNLHNLYVLYDFFRRIRSEARVRNDEGESLAVPLANGRTTE